jgi:murein DD-endopeptidase MepM/ murein hydrolase activator NlpD
MTQFLLHAGSRFINAVISVVLVLLLPVMASAQPEHSCSVVGYFDAQGRLVQSPVLDGPLVDGPLVDGTRISDEFGMRLHPVFHKRRMHWGTDCAAPFGSPIHVVADGTVEEAGLKGPSGLYVRVRHDSTFETGYAHGSRLGRGIHAGAHVVRGQVILYAGSSGVTDGGSHLHLEIFRFGKRVAPAVRCNGPVLLGAIHTRSAVPHRRKRRAKPSTCTALPQRRGF